MRSDRLEQVEAARLVLAAGGLSYPTLGTDGTVHRLLAALGHRLAPPYPALTPLLGPHPGASQLAGGDASLLLSDARRPHRVCERAVVHAVRQKATGAPKT